MAHQPPALGPASASAVSAPQVWLLSIQWGQALETDIFCVCMFKGHAMEKEYVSSTLGYLTASDSRYSFAAVL